MGNDAHICDASVGDACTEIARDRLHLGKFGHVSDASACCRESKPPGVTQSSEEVLQLRSLRIVKQLCR